MKKKKVEFGWAVIFDNSIDYQNWQFDIYTKKNIAQKILKENWSGHGEVVKVRIVREGR